MNILSFQQYLIFVLSIFLFSVAFKSVAQSPEIDSLQNVLKQNIDEEQKSIALAYLSKEMYLYDTKKSFEYAKKSIETAKKVKSKVGEAIAYKALGYYYHYEDQLYLSRQFFQSSLTLYESLKDQKGIADGLHNIGLTYYSAGDYEKSLEYYLESLEMEKTLGDELRTVPSYLNIALVLEKIKQADKALEYYQKAFDISLKNKKDEYIIATSHNLSHSYFIRKDYEKALAYSDTTLKYSEKIQMQYGIAKAKSIQAEVYNGKKEIEKALKAAQEAEVIFKELGMKIELVNMIIIKANSFEAKKDFINMKKAIQKALTFISAIENPELISQIYLVLYKANKGLNNYQEALEAYEKKVIYKDSLFKLEKDKQINELLTKYESAEKELTIKELDEKNRIQASQIERQTYQTILAVVVLLLFSGIGLVFYQQKRLGFQQKLLNLEQKHLRSQLNPHFIFNALNAIQNYMFQQGTEKASFYLAKFSKLMRQILENSRADYISLEKEIETLENYISLQQLRFENKFDYQIRVDENIEVEDMGVPPMFLQPFVENAIEHGLFEIEEKGNLQIYLKEQNGFLSFSIEDNGVGIDSTPKKQNSNHKSLATTILQERIEVFRQKNKKDINFEVMDLQKQSNNLKGTKVNLQLPYIYF